MSLLLSGTDGLSDVDGTAATPAIRGTDANTGIFFPAADTIAFSEGGAEVARFDSSGNLGIGTNAPNQKLVVANSAATYIQASNTSGTPSNIFVGAAGADNVIISRDGTTGDKPLSFYIGTAERARIDSSGNLLVGTTTYATTPAAGVSVQTGNNASVNIGHTNSSSGFLFVNFGYNSGQIGSITQSGTTAVSYNTVSDYRLKKDVKPMQNALATVAALKPCTYTWKADGSAGQGFIAHELQAVVPDCVTGEKDAVETVDDLDADGKKIGTKEVPRYQGVDTSFLVATLVAAIQELKAEFDAYKATHP
jgi:hypothetical protein